MCVIGPDFLSSVYPYCLTDLSRLTRSPQQSAGPSPDYQDDFVPESSDAEVLARQKRAKKKGKGRAVPISILDSSSDDKGEGEAEPATHDVGSEEEESKLPWAARSTLTDKTHRL